MIRTGFIFFMMMLLGRLDGQEPQYLELHKDESRLETLFGELYSDTPANADSLLGEINTLMETALIKPGAMDYPWSRLTRIGVKRSDDHRIRIFSWHVKDNPDSYRYYGFIQVRQKREKIRVFALKDNFKPQRGVYRAGQTTNEWYGKLYYSIVTRKVKRKTTYTLLGLDFNNSHSNIKSVEVMTILRNKPKFEKEMFSNGHERVDRVVLEYSSQVSITVRYDPMMDMIIFDHLVPLYPVYKNNFEFYGPDGSFDGLEFNVDTWILREDIDARLEN